MQTLVTGYREDAGITLVPWFSTGPIFAMFKWIFMSSNTPDSAASSQIGQPMLFGSAEKRRFVLTLLLIVIVLSLYSQTSHFAFLNYDDGMYVLQNPHVRSGLTWSTFTWAMTSTYANWHPVTWLSHALDYELFRLNPGGHHFVNVLLHALNAVLLFWLLARATGRLGASFVVAALFAVHPLNVESVAWIAERKNVLSTTFFLMTLGAYGWYALKPGIKRYLPIIVVFALGLASKSMLVTLPFVLLLLDYWPLERLGPHKSAGGLHFSRATTQQLFLEKIPLFLLSAADCAVTLVAQHKAGAVTTFQRFPFGVRLENAIYSYAAYLWKTIWPVHLANIYPHPGNTLAGWKVATAAALLMIATAMFFKWRSSRYLIVGWLYFLGTLVPVIGLVQVGDQAMADRYTYVPLIGIFVIAVWGAAEISARTSIKSYLAPAVSIIMLGALSIATYIQIGYWKDSVTLWSHTLAETHDNFAAENGLGGALLQAGRPDEAFNHFQRAASIAPDDPLSHADMGTYLHQHGRLQEAIKQYEAAIQLTNNPGLLVNTYTNLGSAYRQMGDYERSQQSLNHALQLDPTRFNVWLQLGNLALDEGQADPAIQDLSHSIALQPTPEGYLQLSRALELGGHHAEATSAHDEAVRLSNDKGAADQAARSFSVDRF
jgi:tetratricopeptide (TPR) repeat protein